MPLRPAARLALPALLLGASTLPLRALRAQPPAAPAPLTVARIFSGEFRARGAGQLQWTDGGRAYLTVEPAPDGRGREIVRTETETGARTVLVTAAMLIPLDSIHPLAFEQYAFSADQSKLLLFANTRKVWREHTRGDYWVLDLRLGRLSRLGGDAPPARLMFATFSPDGRRVAYVRDHDLYVEHLATGGITRLTRDGSRTRINGTSDWVHEEELGIRQAFAWSPDGRRLLFWHFDASRVRDFLLINDTDSLYPTLTAIPYPKAGEANARVTLGVVAATGGPVTWLDVTGDPRASYVGAAQWLDARRVLVQHLDRRQQRNDFRVVDAATGRSVVRYTDRDSAWVLVQEPRRLADGALLVESERDGWRHVYRVALDGTPPALRTPGAYDATLAGVDEPAGALYVLASPGDATRQFLHRVPLAGGAPVRVTPAEPGTHRYDISPDGRWAVHVVSRTDLPPRTELVRLPSHEVVRVLEDNAALRARVAALGAPPTEFLTVRTDDGLALDGWLMRPAGFDSTRAYPVLVQVYGEPAAQTVVDRWGGEGALFHRLVADQAYLVVSFDPRGTPAPRGRAWRKGIYGAVGATTAAELAGALRALARARPYVDTTRVAIWGWSGGGTNTLNAMFREPGMFHVGMAVAPVPDQRLYDTIYQERYMGLPQENADGYRRGSAIHHAEGLRGALLVVHGSGDDNVHYQGTERLVNRLVALGKRFDLMVYPNRSHAIAEGEGTTVHVYELLQRYLREHLPAGGRARP